MSIINSSGLDASIRTVHISFEVSGTWEDLWLPFLLRHFGSCYVYRRRQLDCKDAMEKPAVCLNCAFPALAMLKPMILLQFKTLFTNSSVDILFFFLWQFTLGHFSWLLVDYIIKKFLSTNSLHWVVFG